VTDRRAALPVAVAVVGLAGSLAVTLTLYGLALKTLDRVLTERLQAAGESSAALMAHPDLPLNQQFLTDVMRANALEAAYVVDSRLRVVADAAGNSGRRVDLLRVDPARLHEALLGRSSVAPGYAIDSVQVLTGYFPLARPPASQGQVLVLEAGEPFVASRAQIRRARDLGAVLSVLCGLGLALIARRSSRAERRATEAAARAARGEALSRVAAMAAHEIRNPLGVIRGTIDLMRERSVQSLSDRDGRALDDIVQEVERLHRLTQDLLDLGSDRPLALTDVSLQAVLADSARALAASHPSIRVSIESNLAELPALPGDPARLRQVFANLLANAAQAQGQGEIVVRAAREGGEVRVEVQDRGPGIPSEESGRIFDLYFTTKSTGTGLGLGVARRFVEQHGGRLAHLTDRKPGAVFEVRLPLRRNQPPPKRGDST